MRDDMGTSDHRAIMDRLAKGEERFASIEGTLRQVLDAVAPLPEMKASVDATKEIVEAWAAVKTGGRFLKWVSGILAAAGAIYVAVKGALLHILLGAVR